MTGYLHDGDCVVAEYDAQGKVIAQYIHGSGLGADALGADGAVSERCYSHNWRGDVIGIADESGAVLARYRYGAFGEIIDCDGAIANDILFSGKRYDSASGLYYFGARYYDASLGRFISADPMEFIDGPNEYVLAMNNPLLWIDPWGLSKRDAWNSALSFVTGAFDYISGVSSANASSIFNPVVNNPIGTVDPFPEFELPTKWITTFPDPLPTKEINPHAGPISPYANITFNPGLQSPEHNITLIEQNLFDFGILKKAVTPPPDPNAQGAHSVIKIDEKTNKITNIVTYEPNPHNPTGFQEIQRIDTGAVTQHEDYNKKIKENISTPHVHGNDIPGGVRPAKPEELPKGN